MPQRATILLTLFVTSIVVGCRTAPAGPPPTRITSFTDPAFVRHGFRRLMVLVDTTDLEMKIRLEEAIVRRFRTGGADAVEGYRILLPTRSWSATERQDLLRANGIDASLLLSTGSSGASVDHVPQVTTTEVKREGGTQTQKKGEGKGEEETIEIKVEPSKETVTTTTSGGYSVTTPWSQMRIVIQETGSSRTAWVASGRLAGSERSDIDSFAERLVRQIASDSLVAATIPKPTK